MNSSAFTQKTDAILVSFCYICAMKSIAPSIKPWHRMGISRKQYLNARPWKKAKMSRAKYERVIAAVPQEVLDEIRIAAMNTSIYSQFC